MQQNSAPEYSMRIGATDRVRLTKHQSLKKYQNPYGDQANELIRALNVAWRARRIIAHVLTLIPQLEPKYTQELVLLNKDYEICKTYLEEHKVARPYQFDQFAGFSYVDLSATAWEGHFSNI